MTYNCLLLLKKKLFRLENLYTQKNTWIKSDPNKMLKIIILKICAYLKQIFNDFFLLGYYLLHFKEYIVIILRKEGDNRDYTNP